MLKIEFRVQDEEMLKKLRSTQNVRVNLSIHENRSISISNLIFFIGEKFLPESIFESTTRTTVTTEATETTTTTTTTMTTTTTFRYRRDAFEHPKTNNLGNESFCFKESTEYEFLE